MSKRSFIALMVVALATVLVTGGLIASNMGFKLNYQLNTTGSAVTLAPGGDGLSNTGTNTIALPFNAQAGIVNTGDLRNDIGTANVQEMQYFLQDTDGFNLYTGAKGSLADNIAVGAGVRVKMATDTNYIVVGSHDPAASVTLTATGGAVPTAPGGDGLSDTGLNEFGVPYHTTAANVGDLRNEIGAANVQEMQTFLRDTDSFNLYTGAKGSLADNIQPGASVRIKMGTTTTFVPSHY